MRAVCLLNLERADQKKQQLTTTALRRCENERSYTAATAEDTRSGTTVGCMGFAKIRVRSFASHKT